VKSQNFIGQLDDAELVRAIQRAERKTSCEIRVFVTDREIGADDVVKRAASRFEKLGMTATRERNAVLLYFAPRSNQFAIVGDKGVHEKSGDAFWSEVASAVRDELRKGRFTEAIVRGIDILADAFARHFPRQADDRNELPNEIERD
jgi:uncharacterized membrane protein